MLILKSYLLCNFGCTGIDEFGLREFDPLPIENPLQFEHNARLVGGHISGKNMMTEGLTSIKIMSLR